MNRSVARSLAETDAGIAQLECCLWLCSLVPFEATIFPGKGFYQKYEFAVIVDETEVCFLEALRDEARILGLVVEGAEEVRS